MGTEVHRRGGAVQIAVDRGCTGEGLCTCAGESQAAVGECGNGLGCSAIVSDFDITDIHLVEVAHGAAQSQTGGIREGDHGVAGIECGINIQVTIDRVGRLGKVQRAVLVCHQDLIGSSGAVVDRAVQGAVCRSPGSGGDRIVQVQGRILVQRDLGGAEGCSFDRLDRVVTGQSQVCILAGDNGLEAVAAVDHGSGNGLIRIPAVAVRVQRKGTAVIIDCTGFERSGESHLTGVGQGISSNCRTGEGAGVVHRTGIDCRAGEDAAVGEGTGNVEGIGGSLDGFCRTGKAQIAVGCTGINALVYTTVIDRGGCAVGPGGTATDREGTGDIDHAIVGHVITIAVIQDQGGTIGNVQRTVNDQLVQRDRIHDIHGGTGSNGDRLGGLVGGQTQSPAFRLHPGRGILGNFKDSGLPPGVVISGTIFDRAIVVAVEHIIRQSRSVCTGHSDIAAGIPQLIHFDLRHTALIGKCRAIQTVPGQDAAVIGTLERVAAIGGGTEDHTVLDRIERSIRTDFKDAIVETGNIRTEDRGIRLSGQVVKTGPGIRGCEEAVISRSQIRGAGEDGVVCISIATCKGHSLTAAPDRSHVGEMCHHVFVDRDSALGEGGIDKVSSHCFCRFRRSREAQRTVVERGALNRDA